MTNIILLKRNLKSKSKNRKLTILGFLLQVQLGGQLSLAPIKEKYCSMVCISMKIYLPYTLFMKCHKLPYHTMP
jgi:hypothetical protein